MASKNGLQTVVLPITVTARKYGYITWHKVDDNAIGDLLGDREQITLRVEGELQKQKRIDRRFRRISVRPVVTRSLPESATTWVLAINRRGILEVAVR